MLQRQQWKLAYTLQAGLGLGRPYTVPGYPTGTNTATGLPWAPATDGLRNITGRVNRDGTVTIYAITSTVSGSGDQGADPNKLVAITDNLDAAARQPAELHDPPHGRLRRGTPRRRAHARLWHERRADGRTHRAVLPWARLEAHARLAWCRTLPPQLICA